MIDISFSGLLSDRGLKCMTCIHGHSLLNGYNMVHKSEALLAQSSHPIPVFGCNDHKTPRHNFQMLKC
jgi:hypothetical protein